MKKIGIVTLPGNFNYGNRLQNYALQRVLKKRGYEVETLEIVFSRKNKLRKGISAFKRCILSPSLIKMLFKKKEYGKKFIEMSNLKTPKLLPFTEKYIVTRCIESESELNGICFHYDYFITGSDQVWNQSSISDSTYFLDFVPYEKRYSYAASFGKSEILRADRRYYKKNLNNMKKISVREKQGKKIIEDLTNKISDVHVDPTMLLTANEWRELTMQEELQWLPSKKFVLVYALRGIDKAKRRELYEIVDKNNYEVISIMGDSIDENSQVLTVVQFVQAIDKAELVITDSFHGAVFSIILNTPFQVLERKTGNMNSRLDTLLEKFNLIKNSNKKNTGLDEILKTDFSEVESILLNERKKSTEYFDSFLGNRVFNDE